MFTSKILALRHFPHPLQNIPAITQAELDEGSSPGFVNSVRFSDQIRSVHIQI